MNNARAIVTQVSAQSVVVSVAAGRCPRCEAGRGCGAGLLGRSGRVVTLTLPASNLPELRPGDGVVLTLGPGRLARGVLVTYGLPLAGLLAGAGLAQLAQLGEPGSVALAAAGLLAGLLAGRRTARRDSCLSDLLPSITAVATGESAA